MELKDIDFEALALHTNKSARTLSRWIETKPVKLKILYESYLRDTEDKKVAYEKSHVILVGSLKGGTGKSTLADSFAYYLDDSVILNIDIAQSAKDFNASPTLDYVDHFGKSLSDIIDELSKTYMYIIIDTPGDYTELTEEAIPLADKFIIPMTSGGRSRGATETTLNAFFGEESSLKGNIKAYFMFNRFVDKKKKNKNDSENSPTLAVRKFKEIFSSFVPNDNIDMQANLGFFGNSLAIETAEEKKMSLIQLKKENPGAYKSAADQMSALCKKIEIFFELD